MKAHFLSSPLFLISFVGIILLVPLPPLLLLQQTASATHGTGTDKTVFMWNDGTCSNDTECANMAVIVNSKVKGSGDKLLMHFGAGVTQTEFDRAVDHMQDVTGITAANKGFEFVDLNDLQDWADNIDAVGFGIVGYNLENRAETQDEWATPGTSYNTARDVAATHGLNLWAAPAKSLLETHGAWDDIVNAAWWVHYQSQAYQDDDSTCAILDGKVADMVAKIEGYQPAQEGEISYQLTTTQDPAPGKTIRQTVNDCTNVTSDDDVDGLMTWSNDASVDNQDIQSSWQYHENHFSDQ